MSIFSINSNCVPLKAYLRADSHSQCFQYSNKSKVGIIGLMLGFIIMMILDVALG